MHAMRMFQAPGFLRNLLRVDAAATGATALLLVVAADVLAPVLHLPAGLLRGAGLALVPFVGWVYGLSRKPQPPRRAMWAVVAINFAWVAASVWLALAGPWQPSLLGLVFVLGQALVVLAFADLGWMGLRARHQAAA